MTWTPKDVADAKARMKGKSRPEIVVELGWVKASVGAAEKKLSKYHNVLTECDGIRFQSKKEAKYYRELQARIFAGEVKYFHRQVIFDLPGGVTYRCDYMEMWANGEIHYVDPKGHRTQTFINKKKQVEALYKVRIEEV